MSTSIEWTDTTWNPVRGCTRVSEGCRYCYAERTSARNLPGHRSPTTGEAFAVIGQDGPHWTGNVELIEQKLLEPLHWKKPRRVFVNSMSDLFHENLPDESIDRVFAVMALTPHITYQVLTKRAKRMREWANGPWVRVVEQMYQIGAAMVNDGKPYRYPLPNVWLGVSVEDQQRADERIPQLLQTPAAIRFVSYEPALAPINFHQWVFCQTCHEGRSRDPFECPEVKLDWAIIDGESGPQARPFHLDWLRSAILQFRSVGVPLFVKQMGADPISPNHPEDHEWMAKLDTKGGNWEVWPKWARVRELPR